MVNNVIALWGKYFLCIMNRRVYRRPLVAINSLSIKIGNSYDSTYLKIICIKITLDDYGHH